MKSQNTDNISIAIENDCQSKYKSGGIHTNPNLTFTNHELQSPMENQQNYIIVPVNESNQLNYKNENQINLDNITDSFVNTPI